jgi:hypothetical protein
MLKKRLNLSNRKRGSLASSLSVTVFLPYLSALLKTASIFTLSKALKYGEVTVLFSENQVVFALIYSQIIPNLLINALYCVYFSFKYTFLGNNSKGLLIFVKWVVHTWV